MAALLAPSISALTIAQDTVSRGTLAAFVGTTTVNRDVYWSIIDNALSNFLGSLQVDGELFISSSNTFVGLTVQLLGVVKSITNNGNISLDSSRSILAPTYNFVGLLFTNNGNMWLNGNGSTGNPVNSITSASWTNNGLLSFSQRVLLPSSFVLLGAAGGSITNRGTICLNNEVYSQTTRINGNGCVVIGDNSNVWIQNSLLAVDPTQTFYLRTLSASMRVEALSLLQSFLVAGFGNGNVLGLSLPITSWNYNSNTGILRISSTFLYQSFVIGTGYNQGNFEVFTTNFGGILTTVARGGIRYNSPVPSGATLPLACKPCVMQPDPPEINGPFLLSPPAVSVAASTSVFPSGLSNATISSHSTFVSYLLESSLPSPSVAPSSYDSSSFGTSPSVGGYSVSSAFPSASLSAFSLLDLSLLLLVLLLSPGFLSFGASISDGVSSPLTLSASSLTLSLSSNLSSLPTSSAGDLSSEHSSETSSVFLSTPSLLNFSSETNYSETLFSTASLVQSSSSVARSSSALLPSCGGCTQYRTTFTTTNSASSVAADVGEYVVTTDDTGHSATYTTNTLSLCSGCTVFPTSFVYTNSAGSSIEKTGQSVVTTDSTGKSITHSTSFGQSCPSCTQLTTTFAFTNPASFSVQETTTYVFTAGSTGKLTSNTTNISPPTTFTTTRTEGSVKVQTEDGVKNTSGGSFTPLTANSGPACPSCTRYSTTFTTTNAYGFFFIGAVELLVTTDSSGRLTTITTNLTPVCPQCTEFPTTFTATDGEGATLELTGNVVVISDTAGLLTTFTTDLGACSLCTQCPTTFVSTGPRGTKTGEYVVTSVSESLTTSTTNIGDFLLSADSVSTTGGPVQTSEASSEVPNSISATECPLCTRVFASFSNSDSSLVLDARAILTAGSAGGLTSFLSRTDPTCRSCSEIPTTFISTQTDTKIIAETGSNGSASVDADGVIVTTNYSGKLATYTKGIEPACPSCTQKSSTFLAIETNVTVATESRNAIITTKTISNISTSNSTDCKKCYPDSVVTTKMECSAATENGNTVLTTSAGTFLTLAAVSVPCKDCKTYRTTYEVASGVGYDTSVDIVSTKGGETCSPTVPHKPSELIRTTFCPLPTSATTTEAALRHFKNSQSGIRATETATNGHSSTSAPLLSNFTATVAASIIAAGSTVFTSPFSLILACLLFVGSIF